MVCGPSRISSSSTLVASFGSVELLPIELSGDWDLNPGDAALLAILTCVELLSVIRTLFTVVWKMR
jgi:hypothetical protein